MEQQLAGQQNRERERKQRENREQWKDVVFYEKIFKYDMPIISAVVGDNDAIVLYDQQNIQHINRDIATVLQDLSPEALAKGEHPGKAVVIEDKNGEQYVVQKDKTTGKTTVTKVEGGGLIFGPDGKMLNEKELRKFDKFIIASLRKYKKEIEDYLAPTKQTGKGPNLTNWEDAAKLSNCLAPHAERVSAIGANIASYLVVDSPEQEAFLESVTLKLAEEYFDLDPAKESETQEKTDGVVCEALVEGDEEGELSLPCLGIFDDCDDVVAMLKGIKNRVSNIYAKLPVFMPNAEKKRKEIYKGTFLTIDGVNYSTITIKNDLKKDTSINPRVYYTYSENNKDKQLYNAGFKFKIDDNSSFKILISDEGDSTLTYQKVEKLRKYLFGNYLPIKDEVEKDEEYLATVDWVSQADETIFGQCTGCWPSKCCRRASEYMMGNTNIANCSDSTIANNAPNLPLSGVITTSTFSDNTSIYTLDMYLNGTLNFNSLKAQEASTYMMDKIKNGYPVLIGVHYTASTSAPPNNTNRATRHFMVVVGAGKVNGQKYFRFYDPGRGVNNEAAATSVNNKLYFSEVDGKIQGIYNDRIYSLTEVLKTN